MRISRNPKIIAGATVIVTAGVFMIAVYGTHDHVPLPITFVNLGALVIGGGLECWGIIEEKRKREVPVSE